MAKVTQPAFEFMPISFCPDCKNEIDEDTCHCGTTKKDHSLEEHPFIPMGCDCFREKTE